MSITENTKPKNPYHPDVVLFLILIPFISAFNYYLTYSNIRWGGFLLLTFSIDTAQGYLAWWAVRWLILFLDRQWPYETGVLKRIVVQLIATLVIGLFIIASTTELISWMVKGKPAVLSFYSFDLFIISIWFFVINGIYIGLYYYNLWRKTEDERKEQNKMKADGLFVKASNQEIKIEFSELAGLAVDDVYVVAIHQSGKKYYLDHSLDKIEKVLPPDLFFRLNRQFILHRQIITGFKKEENGKIVVMSVKPECFPTEITVSRIKAPAFKAWFRPGQ